MVKQSTHNRLSVGSIPTRRTTYWNVMSENKKPKIEFAPGCFDDFEGTQEELAELVSEIQLMFENMTTDELESRSRSVNMADLAELDPETQKQILSAMDDLSNEERTRRLN